jgi:hypothetical protein
MRKPDRKWLSLAARPVGSENGADGPQSRILGPDRDEVLDEEVLSVVVASLP